ncbi:transmembrane protein 131 homolog [Topomyia yanbarensis]|uniref:transmembrane protein 131 homolog n=1 Tax=Topomyia yanbarensis TaxID=2498891 RepID=UPI00273B9820|nr:transmembrane protein 131 homolog [Topomyia yanbarensis]
MASRKRSVRVFSLVLIFLHLEVQVRSQPSTQQQHNEQLSFGAQEMFSPSSQTLMDEMFQRGEGVARGGIGEVAGGKSSPELVGNLIFQPSLLDFVERSIGDPHNQVVILINKHKSRSVFLGSISGSTPDFYSSYFKDMVIPPEGNTTFNVVFLPRQLGATAGSIEIHTSFGLLQYQVRGVGIECPYRLRPLVGLVAPLNATITPEITLYNPHDTPLQIVEIYSSGGNFQLELPSGAQEGPQALWEIPPHSTRSVIRVRFHGKTAGNHTAYVRIKISGGSQNPSLADKMLVVPIEIEISKETGIYSKVPFLDLGVGGIKENITRISLNLTNSGDHKIDITSYGVHSTTMEIIKAVKVFIDTQRFHPVFEITVNWTKLATYSEIKGFLYVDYTLKDSPKNLVYAWVEFYGQVLKGKLEYNTDALKFLTFASDESERNSQLQVARPLVVWNKFNVPFSISNITVPDNCSRNFRIEGFLPKTILPDQEQTLFRISRILADNLNRSIATYIRLVTNVTEFDLPVYSYTGKLKRILPFSTTAPRPPADYEKLDLDERELNFGILPISTIGETLIAFYNTNPVEISIRHWKGAITSEGSGAPTITVILRGCGPHSGENLIFCNTIQPNHWIVFQVSVQSSTTDSYQGRFSITTDYEEIVTPITFTTAVGKLELNRELLHFDSCFPGKLCSLNLTAHSTFLSKIHVEGIKTDVDGIEFTVENRHPVIHPNTITNIGRLIFDPKVICKQDCYSSFDLLSKPFGVKWMATLDNYEQYRKLDSEKLLQQLRLYSEMKQSWKSIRFQLTTDPIRKFEFNASVDLVWPNLLTENIHFPTLQIEQEAVKLITINNPSDQILFVHLVLHDVGVHGSDVSALPPEILSGCENCSLSDENVFSFFLFDYDDIYVNYVKPKSFLKIAVKFTAKAPGTYSTIFYMRNNLTLIDAVWIQAKAVVPQFKFGNRKPGATTALLFEITDKHLKMCTKSQEPEVDESGLSIQTMRSFTAKNYGEVPIAVSGIRVEDILCEGYGFKVLDCSPFELQPNASKKIEIAFSPDFTLARVTRTLNFDTNINFPVNFTLLGTVPAHGLESCSLSLKRPWFEGMLRIGLICVLSLVFAGTLMAAFLDANKVIKDHILNLSRDRGPIQPPLDLRQISLQSSTSLDDNTEKVSVSQNSQAKNSQNNSSKKRPPAKQLNSKISNGNSNNFNKSWNDFTSKLGKGFNSKPAEISTNKPSPESDKRFQKSRRSITPPKEETQLLTSVSNSAISTNFSAKERNRPSVEEDSSSTTTESSETSSTISSASTSSLSAVGSYKSSTTADTKSSKPPAANHHQQHNAQPKTNTSDIKLESNSTSSSQSHTIINQSHQQPKTLHHHHHHQPQHSSHQSTAAKMNVKKTKSLPANYETAGVPLSLGTSIVSINHFQSHSKHTNVSSTSYKETGNSSGGLRNSSKNHGNDRVSGRHSNKNSEKREHTGKENGNAFGEHGGKNDSSQSKKFGKTPGRERKTNNQGKKGSKTLHKAQALHFSSSNSNKSGNAGNVTNSGFFHTGNNNPANQIPAPPNVWGENRARFSDVLAQATLDKSPAGSASSLKATKLLNFDSNPCNYGTGPTTSSAAVATNQQHPETPKMGISLFGKTKDEGFIAMEKELNVGSCMAPIGTSKKSPSATPKCWEPFGNVVNRPATMTPGPDTVNSDSYFSQSFVDYNHASNDQFHTGNSVGCNSNSARSLADIQSQSAFGGMNGSHGGSNASASGGMDPMNDLNPMIMDHRDWDTNKLLWQMIQKNEDLNPSPQIDWTSLWTAPTVFSQPGNQHMHQQQPTPHSSSTMHMNSRLTNNWLNGGGGGGTSRPSQMPLRAPPGFSPVKPTPNPSMIAQAHAQAQQQQMNAVHQQQMQQQQHQQQQQHDQQDNDGPPAYDPFRLSSIWAPASSSNDVWNEK